MAEKTFELTAERMEKMRQAMIKFRDEMASHFKDMKDMTVEVKDWRFATEKTQEGQIVDASVKLVVKSKK